MCGKAPASMDFMPVLVRGFSRERRIMFHVKHFAKRILAICLVVGLLLYPVRVEASDISIALPEYSAYGEYPLLALLLMLVGMVANGDIEVVPDSTILGMAIHPSDKAVLEQIIAENQGVNAGSVVELTVEEQEALRSVADTLNGMTFHVVLSEQTFETYADIDNFLSQWGLSVPSANRTMIDEALEFFDNVTAVHVELSGGRHYVYLFISENTAVATPISSGVEIKIIGGGVVYGSFSASGAGLNQSTSGVTAGVSGTLELLNAATYSVAFSGTMEVVDAMESGVSADTSGMVDTSTTPSNVGTRPIYVTVPISITYPGITDSLEDIQSKVGAQTGVVPVPDIADETAVADAVAVASSFVGDLAAYQIPILLQKVPFCFLTDAARIMGMFVQDPVTPELNFDLPTGIDAEGELTYTHIDADFHQYDDLAATVRFWETVGFLACFLILTYQQKHGGD